MNIMINIMMIIMMNIIITMYYDDYNHCLKKQHTFALIVL